MDASQLRDLQAPLKERYNTSPAKAVTPARAEAVIQEDDISCRISTYAGTALAGLHPATGGDGSKACSADMLMWQNRDGHEYMHILLMYKETHFFMTYSPLLVKFSKGYPKDLEPYTIEYLPSK